jgi:AcrR family transcriptional regulator
MTSAVRKPASTAADRGTGEGRATLSRQLILRGALGYVDEHGLESLSMHKLAASLGVRAMSLYKYVESKDDLLGGVVELMWSEVPTAHADDWRTVIRQIAESLRDLVYRHPKAAPLLTTRQSLLEHPLLICQSALKAMRDGGVPEECAVTLLRVVFPYAIGYALAELSLPTAPGEAPCGDIALVRRVVGMLPSHCSDDLVRTALLLCGDCNLGDQFHVGVDLMVRGLTAYLDSPAVEGPAAAGGGLQC